MIHRGWSFLTLGLVLAQPLQAAPIYKWVDEQGITHYSNLPRERQRHPAAVPVAADKPQQTPVVSVYKFRDARGVTHYTDRRPVDRSYTVISTYCPACDPRSPINWGTTRLNADSYAAEINGAASRWKVDPALVRAIVHAESAFRPGAVSRKGAQGLMQLMPATAQQYGVNDPFDAQQNIDAGTRHLASLLDRYRGDVRLAAAAYNAGSGAVARYGGVPPYAETQVYVERVGLLHQRYRSQTSPAGGTASGAGVATGVQAVWSR